jgi:hypothetical protein
MGLRRPGSSRRRAGSVSDQNNNELPDPIRTLENTRWTHPKLVQNIEAAIATAKEPARPGR